MAHRGQRPEAISFPKPRILERLNPTLLIRRHFGSFLRGHTLTYLFGFIIGAADIGALRFGRVLVDDVLLEAGEGVVGGVALLAGLSGAAAALGEEAGHHARLAVLGPGAERAAAWFGALAGDIRLIPILYLTCKIDSAFHRSPRLTTISCYVVGARPRLLE